MFTLKKKSAMLALSTGLVLTVAACGGDDPVIDNEITEDLGQDAEPVAELENLTGVSTAVDAEQSFLDALESLNLTPGVVGDARLEGTRLVFPITGGEVAYYDPDSGRDPFVEGEIEHEDSGLSLSGGGTTVELTDFVVDPGESILTGTVSANGDVVDENVELFFLDGRTLEPLQLDEAEGTAVLEGTTVSLTQEAADLLNDTFDTDALSEFFLVGTATITLALPGAEGAASPTATADATATATATPTATEEPTADATPTDVTVTPTATPTS